MLFSFFLADLPKEGAAAPAAESGIEQTLIMIALAIVFFYFIMWRPESKRRKEMEKKRSAMKKGDRIIVAGGIVGEVSKIQQDTVIIRLIDGAKMEVMKAAIQDIQPNQSSKEATEEEKEQTKKE